MTRKNSWKFTGQQFHATWVCNLKYPFCSACNFQQRQSRILFILINHKPASPYTSILMFHIIINVSQNVIAWQDRMTSTQLNLYLTRGSSSVTGTLFNLHCNTRGRVASNASFARRRSPPRGLLPIHPILAKINLKKRDENNIVESEVNRASASSIRRCPPQSREEYNNVMYERQYTIHFLEVLPPFLLLLSLFVLFFCTQCAY